MECYKEMHSHHEKVGFHVHDSQMICLFSFDVNLYYFISFLSSRL